MRSSRARLDQPPRAPWIVGAILVSAFACFSGCSRDDSRLAVEGEVTIDGKPLPDGKISFMPLPGTASPTAGATITNGKFTIARDKGVRPGAFRVEIKALRTTGKKARDDLSGESIDQKRQYIPDRYNENSGLTAEIKNGETNHLTFTLSEK